MDDAQDCKADQADHCGQENTSNAEQKLFLKQLFIVLRVLNDFGRRSFAAPEQSGAFCFASDHSGLFLVLALCSGDSWHWQATTKPCSDTLATSSDAPVRSDGQGCSWQRCWF
jgi:hypothetical protein